MKVPGESKVVFWNSSNPEVFSSAEQFAESKDENLSILVIDNIDRICVKRSEYDQENVQVVSQLLTCIDGLCVSSRILVLATATEPYLLDAALRRAGRFDREVAVYPPSQEQRESILRGFFSRYGVLGEVSESLRELGLLTRGFSGADLELFARQATMASVEQGAPLTAALLVQTLAGVTPSVMKDQEHVEGVSWESIGGMVAVKTQLRRVRSYYCSLCSTSSGRSSTSSSLHASASRLPAGFSSMDRRAARRRRWRALWRRSRTRRSGHSPRHRCSRRMWGSPSLSSGRSSRERGRPRQQLCSSMRLMPWCASGASGEATTWCSRA